MKLYLKIVIILICIGLQFLTLNICNAQNLVLNGNFEDTLYCPNRTHSFEALTFWNNPSYATPDFFHRCDTDFMSHTGVPTNWLGYQEPHSGNGYAGIYLRQTKGYIWHEYIEGALKETLVANDCYHFKMFINLADSCSYTTDDIAVYFSDTLYKSKLSGLVLPLKPQIVNDPNNIMDTINWLIVESEYIAKGGENYIIIGNFKSDAETTSKVSKPNGWDHIYCYIDDVSLTKYLPCNTSSINPYNTTIKVFPNPVLDQLNISIENNNLSELIIFDITLRTLIKKSFRGEILVSTNQFRNGVYFYQVTDGNKLEARGKFLKK